MPIKTIEKFEVKYLQILNEKGVVDKKLEPKLSKADLKKMYKLMVLARVYDEICLKLQREGRMGTYPPLKGQEASQIGSAFAMKKTDWMFPSFREAGVYITRGVPIKNTLLVWMGNEEGNNIPDDKTNFSVSVPVGTQILHAVGAGWAAKLKGDNTACVVYFGDGATSEGDFHEAFNFAGVFQTNTVFICQNNQFAISVPRYCSIPSHSPINYPCYSQQSASKTLAQKAFAYGFEGIQVDGNDVLAVYSATKKALENARSGKGPAFIECLTFRMGPHTTADDPLKYRNEKEYRDWEKKDPISRFQIYLKKKKIWDEKFEQQVQTESKAEVNKGVTAAEAEPKPRIDGMFAFVFEEMPPRLKEQMNEAEEFEQN